MSPTQDGRPRRTALRWTAGLLALALLALLGAEYATGWGRDRLRGEPAATPTPDPLLSPAAVPPPPGLTLPSPHPAGAVLPADRRTGRLSTESVDLALTPLLTDRRLSRDLGPHVSVAVADLPGGPPVFDNGAGAVTPASTMKLLTTTAALATLGPDRRFRTTTALGGPARRPTVYLVGGGDPFLASRPGSPDAYPARADVVTLARRTTAALRRTLPPRQQRRPVRVVYDDSLFTGPAVNPAWPASYLPDQVVAPITALWVDEGHDGSGWGRVDDPSRRAADVFVAALRAAGTRVAAVRHGVRPETAEDLADVEGAPLSQIAERILEVSDNEAAEVVAHHVGLEVGGDGSFTGGAAGVRRTLARLGIPLEGAVIRDGSGLSRLNRLTPRTLIAVLQVAAAPKHPELRATITGLPVAGFNGSLAYRYVRGAPEGKGRVRAKTGTLTGVSGLSGVATDLDGNVIAFSINADRIKKPRTMGARAALDMLTAALGACHCSG